MIWNKIEELARAIEVKFQNSGEQYQDKTHEYNWHNSLFRSSSYRRAHLEIVDNRDSHGIYIVHSTIFPHFNDCSPIWGFDVVCGANKITGAFHDFSSGGDPDHFMINWFRQETHKYSWVKPRQLPDWALSIFSDNMIAVSNVREGLELDNICRIALDSLTYYLGNVGVTQNWPADYHMAQNRYCYYQKQNPHVINSMVSMGVPKETITKFVEEVLFPEIQTEPFL